jgi:dTDP-4-dehydrorhamnose 3,5-epimerase
MLFQSTELDGVMLVDLERRDDDRGFFARAFCVDEFAAQGLESHVAQANMSGNHRAGTTRGLHFQDATAPEAKFFRCIAGETFHVAVDARPDSPSFGSWVGARLSAAEHRALYIPPLFAAGYQALTDGAEVLYLCSTSYAPAAERGLRLDDPSIGIEWPLEPSIVSDKDRAWPLIDPSRS